MEKEVGKLEDEIQGKKGFTQILKSLIVGILTFYAAYMAIALGVMVLMFIASKITNYELSGAGWVYPLIIGMVTSPIIAIYSAVNYFKNGVIKSKGFKALIIGIIIFISLLLISSGISNFF